MSTTDTLDFAITPSAITQVSHILSTEPKGAFFRIAIKGGGCSGFSYEFNVDHEIQDDDLIFPCGDYQLIVDDTSLAFLKNAQFDYVTQLIGSQFEINNPNAKSSCGCGVSFSL
ncbi:MAG: iron-sulfur cluster assembly accessory protein [Alphaproteobacteria bacterium]|jgi:iron-sulfur cluster assembly accessory protein